MTIDTEQLFANLTQPQREAVSHVDGPLLVLAGPGSGKTTVVTRRIANLIANGAAPWEILALTFTNKAAGEMRDRVVKALGGYVDYRNTPTVATFHSFCARQLRRYADAAGLAENYSIYDSADQRDAIKLSLKKADLDSKNWTPGSVAAAISNAKNQLMDAATYSASATDFYTRSISKIYTHYQKILKDNDALDFDDLLMKMANLLRDSEDVREQFQNRFQYLLIDEYQDTNHAQFVIAYALAGGHQNICVVGDPDQSIYGWRGADITNILEFEEHFPNAKIVALGQNFRSTGHIVDAAAGLIENNSRRKHKRLHTELGEGEKPTVSVCLDEHHEARLVTDFFSRLHEEDDLPWKEMAVLYRVNSLSRVLEEAFRKAKIPYVIARGTAFYDRKEIKDALSYLRLVVNPNDEVALRRIINTPTRGIGKTTLSKIELAGVLKQLRLFDSLKEAAMVEGLTTRAVNSIKKFVAMIENWQRAALADASDSLIATNPLAGFVEQVIRESGLEAQYKNSKNNEEDQERLENLSELISASAQFVPEPVFSEGENEEDNEDLTLVRLLAAFLESVALVSDADAIDPESGTVTLMTLHAAKGMEYEAVAIVGLEENLLPHMRAIGNEMEMEEERRLCFVGITRAKRRLQMSRAAVRTHRGMRERTMESRFLSELPSGSIICCDQSFDEDIDDTEAYSPRSDRRLSTSVSSGEFPIGCVVRHAKFGLGTVQAITPRAIGASVSVSFSTVGTKTLILEYAKLERVG
ncbi:MAG: UvrD-helicase domain-containing protein [Planctomycetes bacterium]|nr:UvrD-helicase domain-containing protein [Planctomycetota bacterium]